MHQPVQRLHLVAWTMRMASYETQGHRALNS
eukprot:SAG31_NODE_42671_length_270_cov_0.906433_1_plen_30_part_01